MPSQRTIIRKNTIISNGTGVGSAIAGSYGTLNIAANGTYTYTSTVSLSAGASSVTDTFTYTTRDNEFTIGATDTSGFEYKGLLSNVIVYNKALAVDEVLQNFNATKHKYGF